MDFVAPIAECFKFLTITMNLYGFEFSFIELITWGLFARFIIWVVWEILYL